METKNIPFNIPLVTGSESEHVMEAIQRKYLAAESYYSAKCASFLEEFTSCKKAIMTTSCTDALEMAAILANIQAGDEVIMASYNFVSAANAFVLRGARICFVDIDPLTMNLDSNRIEPAITDKTKVIIAMHYGGVACDMDMIMALAKKYNLLVIEDAAHCIGSYYKGRHLGSIGHLGTLSFHETKNIQCGEGGALLINDEKYIHRAQIIRDKGTDRSDFQKGVVKKYTWVDIGSSFGMSELNAAFLYAQLQNINKVTNHRSLIFHQYCKLFKSFKKFDKIDNPGNYHIFYLILPSNKNRDTIILRLKDKGIQAASHYEPLHNSIGGKRFSYFHGSNYFTTIYSQNLLRLPIYFNMTINDVKYIYNSFIDVYNKIS